MSLRPYPTAQYEERVDERAVAGLPLTARLSAYSLFITWDQQMVKSGQLYASDLPALATSYASGRSGPTAGSVYGVATPGLAPFLKGPGAHLQAQFQQTLYYEDLLRCNEQIISGGGQRHCDFLDAALGFSSYRPTQATRRLCQNEKLDDTELIVGQELSGTNRVQEATLARQLTFLADTASHLERTDRRLSSQFAGVASELHLVLTDLADGRTNNDRDVPRVFAASRTLGDACFDAR